MNIESLTKIVSELEPLAEHIDYILNIAKPSVEIELVDEPATADCSRFGGHPFVPPDLKLPELEIGEYRFLGQINFAEITDSPSILPKYGLLSLFYLYDKNGEVFWGDDGYVLGFYWEDLQHHIVMRFNEEIPETKRIKLTTGLNLPRSQELKNDYPFNEESADCFFEELPEQIDAKDEYLLGYPSFNTLGYDPTPGTEWISLLTVHSIEEFDWCWHDGDRLMVFIEADKLANKDFSNLKCDAG
ncbi:conserved hypothetical protein [Hyella patelloides LEGE 07179]|uniref:DUF1963 domain-containing protein n=1 Tax=Hyella patelloides LEGE 07179 TaxID=945734 RepID=A0A563W1K2_9CYAN|nr:YwqG family protein [Hyella patelloides]VEP17515.1 conserved hypothetical protein [Hyella patelloides LEGE 07179]